MQNIYSIYKNCVFVIRVSEKNQTWGNGVLGTFDDVKNVPDVNFIFCGHHIYDNMSIFVCRMLSKLTAIFIWEI